MAKKKAKRTRRRTKGPIAVEATTHASEKRLNIPTAEHEPLVTDGDRAPRPVRYPRNTDLDPQLVWRGKDEQDGADLVVPAPPLYIQEKVTPKTLVDDLLRATEARRKTSAPPPPPPPPRKMNTNRCRSSRTSTACRRGWRRPTSTDTGVTGRTA